MFLERLPFLFGGARRPRTNVTSSKDLITAVLPSPHCVSNMASWEDKLVSFRQIRWSFLVRVFNFSRFFAFKPEMLPNTILSSLENFLELSDTGSSIFSRCNGMSTSKASSPDPIIWVLEINLFPFLRERFLEYCLLCVFLWFCARFLVLVVWEVILYQFGPTWNRVREKFEHKWSRVCWKNHCWEICLRIIY